jgi:type VI secretion system protein ImpL
MLKVWPTRAGVTDSAWQTQQNCWLLCPESAVSSRVGNQPDAELVGTVRQICLSRLVSVMRSLVYQEMLQRIARNWPDLPWQI